MTDGPRTLPAQRVANLLVRGLLRTPGLSRIVGSRLVTLYVVGRKSGRRYTLPVAYVAKGNELLVGTSFGWAKNLRDGEPLAIRLKGRLRLADVVIATGERDVVTGYAHMVAVNPAFAAFNRIRMVDGTADQHDLHAAWAAGARVITLSPR